MAKARIVDADGHVLEPLDLWIRYIDPGFAEMAPRAVRGPNGKQYFQVEGRLMGHPTTGISRAGSVSLPIEHEMEYEDGRKGGFDPNARIDDLDLDGIDVVHLYPTLGLFVSGSTQNPKFAAALCRAYNRWLADFCSAYPSRLFGVAMLPMQSVEAAVEEMTFARKQLGMKSAFIRPNPYNGRLLCDEAYNPLWATAQDLDVSIGIHEGTGGMKAAGVDRVKGWAAQHIVSHPIEMQLACLNVIWGGVCERFPKVRFAFLESGGGWLPSWLDRMDRHFDRKGLQGNPDLTLRPSEYFKRQCWISFEPVEGTIAYAADYLGADKLLWATDYPHSDGFFPGAVKMIEGKLPEKFRSGVLGGGAIEFYGMN